MNLTELNKIATAMVAPGKGILAADESSGTIKKRFDAIGVESTEDNRRDYREMLFRSTEGMKNISGVILYDETIWQKAKDGTPLVELIRKAGAPQTQNPSGETSLPTRQPGTSFVETTELAVSSTSSRSEPAAIRSALDGYRQGRDIATRRSEDTTTKEEREAEGES